MKKALVLTVVVAVVLALPGVALAALPSETPDDTLMVDGRVRAIEQVGTNVWMGGKFTQVMQPNGTVVANVLNVAVLDSVTGQSVGGSKNIAPKLGGTGAEVFDMALYRTCDPTCSDDVLIAGKFAGPSTKEKNLVLVDGATGEVLRWYNAPALKSVLAAPDLGRVYGGGVSLSAFDVATGKKLWTRAKTTVDESLRTHDLAPAYRDLELDGSTIWAACSCDAVDGNPAKALVKLSSEGVHDASWVARAGEGDLGEGAFGHSLVDANGALYLGAGGSDFVAEFRKTDGTRRWVRDTSGSTQGVEVMDDRLVIGGHFWEVAVDEEKDKCGAGQDYSATKSDGITPKLDPEDNGDQIDGECATRHGVAAYEFDGRLDLNWSPQYSGSYSLLWTLHVEGTRLHTGGQFKKINGVTQTNYARLSPTVLP